MQADNRQLAAERQLAEQKAVAAERQLASVEASARDAENRLATVAAGLASAEGARRDAVQQVFGLEAELAASKSWLGQISQYHRIYASTARRHLVEVGADEEQHIREWLTKMLGRQILIPDLSRFGVTFAGARLLGINEKPVAQLVYLDADDQPLALCIIPSTGAAKGPTLSANRDLNLVDWRDGKFGYAVVGWSNPELLASLTQAIRPVYDL
jgi:anti-sigma factor RsiW